MTSEQLAASSIPEAASLSSRVAALFQQEKSSREGLSSAEAALRLARFGPNTIADRTESKWHKLAAYFWGPLPFLIEAAAIISALRRDWGDFAVVAGLLIYNAAVGFWQDNKDANALAALKKGWRSAPVCVVMENGKRLMRQTWCRVMWSTLLAGRLCRRMSFSSTANI
jgi:H+-transporting ATPase